MHNYCVKLKGAILIAPFLYVTAALDVDLFSCCCDISGKSAPAAGYTLLLVPAGELSAASAYNKILRAAVRAAVEVLRGRKISRYLGLVVSLARGSPLVHRESPCPEPILPAFLYPHPVGTLCFGAFHEYDISPHLNSSFRKWLFLPYYCTTLSAEKQPLFSVYAESSPFTGSFHIGVCGLFRYDSYTGYAVEMVWIRRSINGIITDQ